MGSWKHPGTENLTHFFVGVLEMKKFFALLSVAAALTISVGCGGKSEAPKSAAPPAADNKMEESKMEEKTDAPAEGAAAPAEEPAK
jgi:hypothetical protein